MKIADVDFVLQKMGVRTGAGQGRPTYVLIFYRPVFVGVADPELVAIGEVVENSSGTEKVMRGVGNGLRDGPKAK